MVHKKALSVYLGWARPNQALDRDNASKRSPSHIAK